MNWGGMMGRAWKSGEEENHQHPETMVEDHMIHDPEVKALFETFQAVAAGQRVNATLYAVGLLLAACVIDAGACGNALDVDDVLGELGNVIDFGLDALSDSARKIGS